jgi:hypothetical protein
MRKDSLIPSLLGIPPIQISRELQNYFDNSPITSKLDWRAVSIRTTKLHRESGRILERTKNYISNSLPTMKLGGSKTTSEGTVSLTW